MVGYKFGKLLITFTKQPAFAPIIDACWSTDGDGYKYFGRAILLLPWRRKYGQSLPQMALVLAWRQP